MRKFMTPIALLAAVSLVVAAKLWMELRSERQLTGALRAELSDARLAGLATPGNSKIPGGGNAPDSVPDASAMQPPAATSTPDVSPQPPPRVGMRNLPTSALTRQLYADPEYRAGRDTMKRLNVRRQSAGLREALGLSASDEEALIALLTANELWTEDQLATINRAGTYDTGAAAEEARIRQEGRQQLEDQLLAKLGGDRFKQWEAYQNSGQARLNSSLMATQLEQYGLPLSRDGIRGLTAAFDAEEKRRLKADQVFAQTFQNADRETRMQMNLQRTTELSRRRLEVAAPFLTAEQLSLFKSELDAQDAMTRAADRIQNATRQGAAPRANP